MTTRLSASHKPFRVETRALGGFSPRRATSVAENARNAVQTPFPRPEPALPLAAEVGEGLGSIADDLAELLRGRPMRFPKVMQATDSGRGQNE